MFADKTPEPTDSEPELTLEDLLARCDPTAPAPDPTGWETRSPAGNEIL